MNDNYPMGAANDPRAPYNEPIDPEIDVTVRTTLVKETVVMGHPSMQYLEYEWDPIDGNVGHLVTDGGDDLKECFLSQDKTAIQIIMDCEKIVKELLGEKKRSYAGIYLPYLLNACDGWEETELTVED